MRGWSTAARRRTCWCWTGASPRSAPASPCPKGARVVEADGWLLSPPFVDAHFHLDATLSHGLPRVNESGTLLEGIALWGELKPQLTQEAVVERALQYCDWAVAKGLLAIRSHVDVCDDRLLAVEALLHVKKTGRTLARPAAGRLSAGRPAARAGGAREPEARARQGRRRGRRHPALRADFCPRRRERAPPVRARRRARPARRHALRRERRPAVAPHRDARVPHAAARAARPRHRLAPDLDAFDGQLLCEQSCCR